ncbi:MAG: glycosyltransferase [Cytophagaceae bacterium]
MSPSPIALFVYNRLDHTRRTIEALKKNVLASESDLIIFSDGPKSPEHEQKVNDVRSYIQGVTGFKTLTIIVQEKNLGLSRSVTGGVTQILDERGTIIVLEDDIVTSPGFLTFMNQALNLYKDEPNVICIHGYVYPTSISLPDNFFLPGADCWGWATWKRGWDLYEKDSALLLKEIQSKKLEREFNFNDSYHYTGILKEDIEGKVDSWAIRWYASAFLKGKFTLYPGKSLVQNIGFDGSGVHCEPNEYYNQNNSVDFLPVSKIEVVKSQAGFEAFYHFFKKSQPVKKKKSFWTKIAFWRSA